MGNELRAHINFEKKMYRFRPLTGRESNSVIRCALKVLFEEKLGCSAETLGQHLLDTFDYLAKNPTHTAEEEREIENKNRTSWKNGELLEIVKCDDGSYLFYPHFRDFRANFYDIADNFSAPTDADAATLGEIIIECFRLCEMYAKRAQLMLFLSDKEGLGICSMAIAKQGNYVLSDYCERLLPPYDSASLKAAIDRAAEHCRNNPDTALSKKELKENAPWKSYSAYKSWNGFVKHNHAIRLMVLPDGSYNFSPEMRFDDYDSHFVPYSCISTVLDNSCTDERLFKRVLRTFENSRNLSAAKGEWSTGEAYADFFDRWLAEKGLPSWRPTDED